nr:MAG TPA: hypothetical protein [Caudoviricetes sp.]
MCAPILIERMYIMAISDKKIEELIIKEIRRLLAKRKEERNESR